MSNVLPWIAVGSLIVAILAFVLNARYDRLRWLNPRNWFKRRPDIVIGVIRRGTEVLLVHRKPALGSSLHWQFPSAHVGAHVDLLTRVAQEVESETGIVARIDGEIGRRRHPNTGRQCAYFSGEYVSGTEDNLEPQENIYVRWVLVHDLEAYLGKSLFPKVKKSLTIR